jgi:hypothetical protein
MYTMKTMSILILPILYPFLLDSYIRLYLFYLISQSIDYKNIVLYVFQRFIFTKFDFIIYT